MPGALPAVNAKSVELAARLGFALGGDVQTVSSFDRKHYFYADLPHGFQITQQRAPVVLGGHLDVFVPQQRQQQQRRQGSAATTSAATSSPLLPRKLRIERLQLEMDTGKSTRARGMTLVDLNRAGSTLIEIVTAPDLRSGEEAAAAAESFQQVLRFLGVGEANMEEGSLRVDVNVSVRKKQSTSSSSLSVEEDKEVPAFGERCEVKNLNSFRSIARAVRHEAERHRSILSSGGVVTRQTRSFDPTTGTTSLLRDKEALLDYRFVPEPDIPPVVLTPEQLNRIAASVPELPSAARARLAVPDGGHALAPKLAAAVVTHPSTLAYYERALAAARKQSANGNGNGNENGADGVGVKPSVVANWVVSELVGAAKKAGVAGPKEPLSGLPEAAAPERGGELLARVAAGELTGRMAKQVLAAMLAGDARPIVDIVTELFGEADMMNTTSNKSGGGCGGGGGGGGGGKEGAGVGAGVGVMSDDDGQLRAMCEDIVGGMPEQVTLYRGGKTRLMGLFVGEVMKRSGGRANPKEAAAIMKSLLDD